MENMENGGRHTRTIECWLLSPRVQFTSGPHRGGVAGWLNEQGEPVFVYPEITGYYLTWLAFLAEAYGWSEVAASHASEAVSWISRHFSNGKIPATRMYVAGAVDDWRNSGAFAFDLAMLARGAATAQEIANGRGDKNVLPRLLNMLLPFCSNGGWFHAFRPHDLSASLTPPACWSSSCGPYQAKVAAAVMSAVMVSPGSETLQITAVETYRRWREYSRKNGLDGEAHPTFYHLEGLTLAAANGWDPDALSVARDAYLDVIGLRNPGSVFAPSFNGCASSNRSDVLAQALRIGCIIRSRAGGKDKALDEKISHLAETLCSFITDEGSVVFSHHPNNRSRNVWSAMFTHQALTFYDVVSRGKSIDRRWLQLLV
jgi:hypothetical protein